jgi:hypothetical protein
MSVAAKALVLRQLLLLNLTLLVSNLGMNVVPWGSSSSESMIGLVLRDVRLASGAHFSWKGKSTSEVVGLSVKAAAALGLNSCLAGSVFSIATVPESKI